MFSLDVVDTDFFLEMPSTARLLYYDLGVRADDDGFISPMKVVKMTGATGDDLKVLIIKGFVYLFEDGVVVILQWLRNNKIENAKYTPSIYNPRLRELIKNKIYIHKLSTGRPIIKSGSLSERAPKGTPKGPQKGPLKGPQDRLGKDRVEISSYEDIDTDQEDEMKKFWKEYAGTWLRNNIPENIRSYRYLKEELSDQLPGYLVASRAIRADEYQKRTLQAKLTNFVGLRESLEQVESYMLAHVDDRAGTFSTSDISKL